MFFIPMMFLAYSDHVLRGLDPALLNKSFFAKLYVFAPFVVASGVGFFPLALTEVVLLLGLPMILIMVGIQINPVQFFIVGHGQTTVSILVLILCTACVIGVSQLGFMLELFENNARDKLTGLFTRAVGIPLLNQQIKTAERNKAPLSVIFIDIDDFKIVNDLYGHQVGDAVLVDVTTHIKNVLRGQDTLIRWGGEEFLIICPDTQFSQADTLLKRLSLEGLGSKPEGKLITASIGVAEFQVDQIKGTDDLISLADKRCYIVKKSGKSGYACNDKVLPLFQANN